MRIQTLLIAAALFTGLGSFTAQAADTDVMDKAIHDYIMNNPEVIMMSLTQHQQKQRQGAADAALDSHGDYLFKGDHPQTGNLNGDVTVVEFFDYNCGYCKRATPDVMKLISEDSNVRLVFLEFPILGPASERASQLALAAKKQNKYQEFHMALMENKGALNEAALKRLAESVELDFAKLDADSKDPKIQETLQKNRQVAVQLGITGTPGFLINENLYPGYLQYLDLKQAVTDARKADKS